MSEPNAAAPVPPEPRAAEAVTRWDDVADVVVVGLGCAGACAALEASAGGAEVLALERAGWGGGTSALSGGLIYLGGGTPVQRACGYEDDPDEMHRFLVAACGPAPDEAKIRRYCDESVAHFHWLAEHGVPFRAAFCAEPNIEPKDDAGLVFSGGEDTWPFDEIARPAPRGHKPQAPQAAGHLLMSTLLGAVERSPVRVETDHRVATLITDRDGAVVGVVAVAAGAERALRARRGVVLAAGGFMMNREMVARHVPELLRCSYPVGSDGDDGSGILLGLGAGGEAIRMGSGECAVPIAPPRRLVRGILVDGHGQRFVNEDAYPGRIGHRALFDHDGEMYLVLDDDRYEINRLGMQATWVAETVAELEAEMGLPDGSLQATVELYNRHAAAGHDPVFRKDPRFVTPLDAPPFGAVDWRVSSAIYAPFTLGGLRTAVTGEVLDPLGRPVPGLHAAGRTTSGIPAHGYVSGISLGDGTFFGRLAGRGAAGA